ncbi:flagellar biosynthetic protein FliP [Desulfurobacterium thermolithotrophum DSM 11699]|uniref:Flagellar biosynthetic protein FliP n=1 Tax=Desulfurobacterium thermolithotrophum (strain DSM 11699 / BSA) TaxID=868864 RepID=F0S0S3_DESTD|nr:flagellar type III secretion system pore protein FliP [Desulfurobacterium thermolithotrophum]ADY73876.1 flagellar biosynthetic protein FliP [Desulfurobacterium thermolithotrophum DSM 11699]
MKKYSQVAIVAIAINLLYISTSYGETVNDFLPQLGNLDITLKILFLITILSLAPAILITVTSFTRIVIILSLLRHALGTPQTPPNQVIIALSLFLTLFTMAPTFQQIDELAIQPYINKKISDVEAIKRASEPIKNFMLRNTRKEDLKLFLDIRNEKPSSPQEISMLTLIPAFMVSEIRTALEVVFVIFLPFIVIDLLVASILMSMGMMMIPPMMLSLPFKLILFVLSDGWELLIKSIILSYR